jgi:hypothetical protein
VVEDTGKTVRADTYKPVNTPAAIMVEENANGFPAAVKIKRREAVMSIEDKWRLDDEWWRAAPVSRIYYNVLLASGRRLVFYKDLVTGNWFQQDY